MEIHSAGVHEEVGGRLVDGPYQPPGGALDDLDGVVALAAQAGAIGPAAPGPVQPVPAPAQHAATDQALRGRGGGQMGPQHIRVSGSRTVASTGRLMSISGWWTR